MKRSRRLSIERDVSETDFSARADRAVERFRLPKKDKDRPTWQNRNRRANRDDRYIQ